MSAQLVGGLISDSARKLKQITAARIEWSSRGADCGPVLDVRITLPFRRRCGFCIRELQGKRADTRVLVPVAEVEIKVAPAVRDLAIKLNLFTEVRTCIER